MNLTKALANQQLQSERQAVTIERMRIARELHDAVAHHLLSRGQTGDSFTSKN
ncbi:hypothetical protein FYJ24_03985 [Actinomycetaceae bacterium WB03_NA08]|uniref:Signal transduction histidine kinase subgroup 3 dimerisation and phosphoacceptor domain-containing protein n=1 Tax=Scrofimicrobium canadense TaxID=2652290 RepID=A0A6N7W6S6_9ACTO|nr:hypothetical protein [Scrofimicrobium canadense]